MADINSGNSRDAHARSAYRGGAAASSTPGGDLDEMLLGVVEMLFFAYRDFTGEADSVLQEFGFGRAHHRVLHFVNRRPGLRVADLLDILRITKQSLARVLKQLVDRGFIAQEAGDTDRRERRLFLTTKGKALAAKLARLQIAQVGRALEAAGAAAGSGAGSDAGSGAGSDAGSGAGTGGGAGASEGEQVRRFLMAMIAPDQRATVGIGVAGQDRPAEEVRGEGRSADPARNHSGRTGKK